MQSWNTSLKNQSNKTAKVQNQLHICDPPHDDVLCAQSLSALVISAHLALGSSHFSLDAPHRVDHHKYAPPGSLHLHVVPACKNEHTMAERHQILPGKPLYSTLTFACCPRDVCSLRRIWPWRGDVIYGHVTPLTDNLWNCILLYYYHSHTYKSLKLLRPSWGSPHQCSEQCL